MTMPELKKEFCDFVRDEINELRSQLNEHLEDNIMCFGWEHCDDNGNTDMCYRDYELELCILFNRCIARGLTREEIINIDEDFLLVDAL